MNILITDLHANENELLEKIVAGDDNIIQFFNRDLGITSQIFQLFIKIYYLVTRALRYYIC